MVERTLSLFCLVISFWVADLFVNVFLLFLRMMLLVLLMKKFKYNNFYVFNSVLKSPEFSLIITAAQMGQIKNYLYRTCIIVQNIGVDRCNLQFLTTRCHLFNMLKL